MSHRSGTVPAMSPLSGLIVGLVVMVPAVAVSVFLFVRLRSWRTWPDSEWTVLAACSAPIVGALLTLGLVPGLF